MSNQANKRSKQTNNKARKQLSKQTNKQANKQSQTSKQTTNEQVWWLNVMFRGGLYSCFFVIIIHFTLIPIIQFHSDSTLCKIRSGWYLCSICRISCKYLVAVLWHSIQTKGLILFESKHFKTNIVPTLFKCCVKVTGRLFRMSCLGTKCH